MRPIVKEEVSSASFLLTLDTNDDENMCCSFSVDFDTGNLTKNMI